MSTPGSKDWTTDLLIGGFGLFIGVVLGLAWKGLPPNSAGTGIGGGIILVALFITAHQTDDPTTAFVGHVGQLIVSVGGGLLLMSVLANA